MLLRIRSYMIAAVPCLALAVACGNLALAKKGKGKPAPDPAQLLVDFVSDPEFSPTDTTIANATPGVASVRLLDDILNGDPLTEFGVSWSHDLGAVVLDPDGGEDTILDYGPFLIALQVSDEWLGASFRISDSLTNDRYLNDAASAPFDPRRQDLGGDVEVLREADGTPYGFVIHVHADGAQLHGSKKRNRNKVAGYISIVDIEFLLDSDGDFIADIDETD